jgi:bacillithiol biosynthesis cysteine-adding enzyme BshC
MNTPLTGSALARIAIDGGDGNWFVKRPSSPEEWKSRAAAIRESLVSPDWLAQLGPAFNATGRALERLERAATSGFAVTTGQQPGLFGGPMYTWWKALSALSLADELEKVTGLPVVPIFWAAADDSDFAEASYTVVSTPDGAVRLEMSGAPEPGTPMSDVPVGDVSRLIQKLADAAGSGASSAVLEVVRECYAPGHTVGSAYLGMLRQMLEPLGIPVIDAAHPAVRVAAYPVLRRAMEKSADVEVALDAREKDLKAAGHSVQVKQVDGRTLVFGGYGGARERVRTRDVAQAIADGAHDSFGPNVLLRPVVERSIIPTVAYVGGPAEVAYFAQTSAVARALGVAAPLVVPRWSGMVIESRTDRILERYKLTVDDFRDPHAVETRIAHESLPEGIAGALGAMREAIAKSSEALAKENGADLLPESVIEGLQRNVAHRLDRVERRYRASVKRRGNEALRDVASARGALFPLGKPQERALNVVPLLARHGESLIDAVLTETKKHAAGLV